MPRSRGRGGRRNPPKRPIVLSHQSNQGEIAHSSPLIPPRSIAQNIKYIWSNTWYWLGIASIIVSLVAGGLYLLPPRVTVQSSGPFDASDPLSTSFNIKNTWILPVKNVQASLGLCKFIISPPGLTYQGDCDNPGGVRLMPPKWSSPRYLDVDEQFAVVVGDVVSLPAKQFGGGDMTVIVTFKPWIIPFRFERKFRFVAERQRDGKFYWTPEALDKR